MKSWDYAASAARGRQSDQMLLDANIDPQTGRYLEGSSGLPISWGRANNRMLEGLISHTGTRPVYDQELNSFTGLHTGDTNSVYDNPETGGTRTIARRYWADSVRPTRTTEKGETLISPWEIYAESRAHAADLAEQAKSQAQAQEVSMIRRHEKLRSSLTPELGQLYDRLPTTEKRYILSQSPERQIQILDSHPLRATPFRPAGTARITEATPGAPDFFGGSQLFMGSPRQPPSSNPIGGLNAFPTVSPRVGSYRPQAALGPPDEFANAFGGDF